MRNTMTDLKLSSILSFVRKRDKLLKAILMNTTSKKLSGDTITLGFDDHLHADVFDRYYKKDFEDLASEFAGRKIFTRIVVKEVIS